MSAVVRLENVSKAYENVDVLKRINLSIDRSQVVGVVGANGSGKSTLLKIAAGLVRPTSGEMRLESGMRAGYVPERFPQLKLTPWEYLHSMGRFQRIERKRLDARIAELLESFGMSEAGHRRMNLFSKGMLQKVNLMQAVLNKPDLLIMDEPLSGLDTPAQHELVRLLSVLKEQGMAMLLSCHEELLLERLADRAVALRAGQLAERRSSAARKPNVEADVVITCRFLSPDMALQLKKRWEQLPLEISASQEAPSAQRSASYDDGQPHDRGLCIIHVSSAGVNDVLRHILQMGGSIVSVIPGGIAERSVETGGEQVV